MPAFIIAIATTLLTYGLHSCVACVIALAAGRMLPRPQDRDAVWKAALLAPIVTTILALLLSAAGLPTPFVDLADAVRRTPVQQLPGRDLRIRVVRVNDTSRVVRELSDPVTSVLSAAALIGAITAAGIASCRLVARRRRMSRAVARRTMIGALASSRGGPVRLSTAPFLRSPIALGTAEICLPTKVVREFRESYQRSLIAHEMAHVDRRDPRWFAAIEIVAAISAFQPLVFTVARAFRRDVELICDETAVRRTGDQKSLIAALALLASPFDARSPLHGAVAAYDGSPLVARATRIAGLAVDGPAVRGPRLTLVAVVILLGLLGAAPVVSAAPRLTDLPLDPGGRLHQARPGSRVLIVDEIVTSRAAESLAPVP